MKGNFKIVSLSDVVAMHSIVDFEDIGYRLVSLPGGICKLTH